MKKLKKFELKPEKMASSEMNLADATMDEKVKTLEALFEIEIKIVIQTIKGGKEVKNEVD